MKGRRTLHFLVVLWLLLLVWSSAHAQGGNLLTNPGFEPPFQTVSGEPPRQVAQGWTPWHISGEDTSFSELIQPEYYRASDDINGLGIPRIHSGNDAQQYFTFFATHTGGVYQTVTGVTPGSQYRFQIFAHVWSTTGDNPEVSSDPGGVIVQVGIDPTGGSNGESSSIVWSSAGSPQYDAYDPYEVVATAQGSAITVFVRSTVSAPVKNNVVYLDDASLTTGGGTQVTNTATATTPPPTNVFPTQPTATGTTGATVVSPTETTAPTTASATNTTAPSSTTAPSATTAATATPSSSPTPSGPTNTPTITLTPSPSPTVDRVTFPNSIIHTVQSGDTVARLSALYGSTIDAIISANGLNPNGLIFVGQGLVIPVRLLPPATMTPTQAGQTPPTAAPPVSTPVPPAPTVPPAQPTTQTYIVRPGDTLSTIAVRFRTTTSTLAQMNNIVNRDLIYYGQRLLVPTGAPQPAPIATAIILQSGVPGPTVTPVVIRTYRVQTGDNLFNIALRFSVSLSRLTQYNGILNPNRIFVGQVLVIP